MNTTQNNNTTKRRIKFLAHNNYDVILSGVKDSKCFTIEFESTSSFPFSSTPFANDFENYMNGDEKCSKQGCITNIINEIKAKGQKKISFEFHPITDKTFMTSFLKIGDEKIQINTNFKDQIHSLYLIFQPKYRDYLLKDKKGSNYQNQRNFDQEFRNILEFVKFNKQNGGKKKSKKSKAVKMTGGQNKTTSTTFKRKKIGMGITPYDLTLSTEPGGIINLEIKITSNVIPFKDFKDGFSKLLNPKNKNNLQTIYDIINLFDQKIERKAYFGREVVVNGQTILFKFNLASKESTVTIGDKSISINTTFIGVLISIYSNSELNLLNKRSNGKSFKNVITNITDKISKEQTNKPNNPTNQITQPTNKTNNKPNKPTNKPTNQ